MLKKLLSKETVISHELATDFNKEAFFKYVEGYVLSSNEKGKFDPGKIEWFIVDYFSRHVFQGADFTYVPEFADAIFELLQRHKSKLAEFARGNKEKRDAMLPEEQQLQYLTIAFPNYNPGRGLIRSMMDCETYMRRKMRKPMNRISAKLRKLKNK